MSITSQSKRPKIKISDLRTGGIPSIPANPKSGCAFWAWGQKRMTFNAPQQETQGAFGDDLKSGKLRVVVAELFSEFWEKLITFKRIEMAPRIPTPSRNVNKDRAAMAIKRSEDPKHQFKFLSRSQKTGLLLRQMVGERH